MICCFLHLFRPILARLHFQPSLLVLLCKHTEGACPACGRGAGTAVVGGDAEHAQSHALPAGHLCRGLSVTFLARTLPIERGLIPMLATLIAHVAAQQALGSAAPVQLLECGPTRVALLFIACGRFEATARQCVGMAVAATGLWRVFGPFSSGLRLDVIMGLRRRVEYGQDGAGQVWCGRSRA